MHQDLKQFLFDYVETYEELGALIWFHRHQQRHASAGEISLDADLPRDEVVEALESLHARGLLAASPDQPRAFCYAPANPELGHTVDRLIRLYDENTMEVVRFMTANAIERVRTAGMRMFAECFRIGGPKSRG